MVMSAEPLEPSVRQPVSLSTSQQIWVDEQESLIADEATDVRLAFHDGRLEEATRDLPPIRERLQHFLD